MPCPCHAGCDPQPFQPGKAGELRDVTRQAGDLSRGRRNDQLRRARQQPIVDDVGEIVIAVPGLRGDREDAGLIRPDCAPELDFRHVASVLILRPDQQRVESARQSSDPFGKETVLPRLYLRCAGSPKAAFACGRAAHPANFHAAFPPGFALRYTV